MSRIHSILIIFFLFGLTKFTLYGQDTHYPPRPLETDRALSTIAFGSCNNQSKPQTIWPDISKNKPDLWIWLGDMIYADTDDMRRMADEYQKQKVNPAYQRFCAQAQILGVWDDHDYGVNDGNKAYAKRAQSKGLLFDFLNLDQNHEARKRDGAYQSYTFEPSGQKVKIILLGTRYFKDELVKNPSSKGPKYLPNKTGDILGFKQWEWLAKELKNSDAQIHLICSSIQVLPSEHEYEKWADFPAAKNKLMKLLVKTQPANPFFLSGDRHMAEISQAQIEGLKNPVYEITSSGLTHTWSRMREEPNQFRVGDIIAKLNYAILHIDWSSAKPALTADIRGENNELYFECQLE